MPACLWNTRCKLCDRNAGVQKPELLPARSHRDGHTIEPQEKAPVQGRLSVPSQVFRSATPSRSYEKPNMKGSAARVLGLGPQRDSRRSWEPVLENNSNERNISKTKLTFCFTCKRKPRSG